MLMAGSGRFGRCRKRRRQSLPGVSLGDQTGNQFQLDINYRGFTAGPVIGTPQGLAVYQNGVRINEVFGDIVNWDLIPQNAINSLTLVPSNPVYGLNAIGGALSLQMKNGFTYHGVEGEVSGGSYGRITTSMQAGGEARRSAETHKAFAMTRGIAMESRDLLAILRHLVGIGQRRWLGRQQRA
jgi:iron complex outermembrane recepter protein